MFASVLLFIAAARSVSFWSAVFACACVCVCWCCFSLVPCCAIAVLIVGDSVYYHLILYKLYFTLPALFPSLHSPHLLPSTISIFFIPTFLASFFIILSFPYFPHYYCFAICPFYSIVSLPTTNSDLQITWEAIVKTKREMALQLSYINKNSWSNTMYK